MSARPKVRAPKLRSPKVRTPKGVAAPGASSAIEAAASVVGPPTTSFDFLAGSYERAARTRLVAVLVVGAVAMIALALVGKGVTTMLAVRKADAQTAQALSQQTAETQELTKVAQVSGIGEPALRDEVAGRKTAAVAAVQGEVAATQVFDAVATAAGSIPGAHIESISFSASGQAGTSTQTVNSPTPAISATEAHTTQASGTSGTTPAASSGSSSASSGTSSTNGPGLTITMALRNCADVQRWSSALGADLPYLSIAGTTSSCGAGGAQLTTTGTLAASMAMVHQNQINAELNDAPPPVPPAQTSPASTLPPPASAASMPSGSPASTSTSAASTLATTAKGGK